MTDVITMKQKQHIIILPYFCQEEVDRYLRIAEKLKSFPQPEVLVHYLLASSPRTEPNQSLYEAYAELAPTSLFQCPSQVFGYPQGPTAMFWDSMEHIAENFADSDGFSLWLESDMAPIKPDWIDRLSDEWYSGARP